MFALVYLLLFLAGGVAITRLLLPRIRPVVRVYTGLSLGVLLMMWLPMLWAYAVRFGVTGHGLAAATRRFCADWRISCATADRRCPLTTGSAGCLGACW